MAPRKITTATSALIAIDSPTTALDSGGRTCGLRVGAGGSGGPAQWEE